MAYTEKNITIAGKTILQKKNTYHGHTQYFFFDGDKLIAVMEKDIVIASHIIERNNHSYVSTRKMNGWVVKTNIEMSEDGLTYSEAKATKKAFRLVKEAKAYCFAEIENLLIEVK